MTGRVRRTAAAVLLMATLLTGVVACARHPDASSETMMENAVVAAVPSATGARVTFSFAGVGAQSVLVRIYLDEVDRSTLFTEADDAIEAIWRSAPTEPSDIAFEAWEGPEPAKPEADALSNVDLSGLDAEFAAGRLGSLSDMFDLSGDELAARYGHWVAPATAH